MLGSGKMHLFIVFLSPTTRLYENERLGTLNLPRIHAFALTVLGREVVRVTVKVFECGDDLR